MNNDEILKTRIALFNKRKGARVGDFLKLRNGQYARFSHDWGNDIQTATEFSGSFYLGKGYCEFSGSLYGAVKHDKMQQIDESKSGAVWFFNNNEVRAHNGFHTHADFRVFEIIDADSEPEFIKKSGLEYQFTKKAS